jgi:hypothetical protein
LSHLLSGLHSTLHDSGSLSVLTSAAATVWRLVPRVIGVVLAGVIVPWIAERARGDPLLEFFYL